MIELKKTISRSFERPDQPGEYHPAKFRAAYSEEISAETTTEEMKRVSAFLYEMAKSDVEQSILEYKQKLAQERIIEQAKKDYKDDSDL